MVAAMGTSGITSFVPRALVAAGLSVIISFAIAYTAMPMMGARFDAVALVMCIVCPVAIAMPVSILTQIQRRKLREMNEAYRKAHADLAAAHLELAEMHNALAEKARRDDMTGLLNRETFLSGIEKLRRRPDAGALLIIDADHFKAINDEHGHQTGDEALLALSAALGDTLPDGDLIGRIGGDEFAVFLPDADFHHASEVAERIRRAVECVSLTSHGGEPLKLTVSIGGTLDRPGASLSALMREADRRLYDAKRGGRNRTELALKPRVEPGLPARRAA